MSTTQTPSQIDARLLASLGTERKAQQDRARRLDNLHRYAGHTKSYVGSKFGYYVEGADETVAAVETRLAADGFASYEVEQVERTLAEYAAAVAAIAAERTVQAEIDAEFAARGGWQRAFLVTSSAGLIHRSMNCSTCNKGRSSTEFALLSTLSGSGVEALVDVLGPALCSVCFPEAPVEFVEQTKFPKEVAAVLLTEGPEAFVEALAAHRAKAEKTKAAQCAGSGQRVENPQRRFYMPCPECGRHSKVGQGNTISRHKAI